MYSRPRTVMQFIASSFLVASCDQRPSQNLASDAQFGENCASSEWASAIQQAGPEIPQINVRIVSGNIEIAPASSIGSMGWESSLLAARKLNPKPVLIVHVERGSPCEEVAPSLRTLSDAYECDPLKCVIDDNGG